MSGPIILPSFARSSSQLIQQLQRVHSRTLPVAVVVAGVAVVEVVVVAPPGSMRGRRRGSSASAPGGVQPSSRLSPPGGTGQLRRTQRQQKETRILS